MRFITPHPRGGSGQPRPTTPHTHPPAGAFTHAHGLASSPFAHHYSGNHNCFLFLRVLRCFTSPRTHHTAYTFSSGRHPITSARLPHSETPGSQPGCRLPEEYRRLPRPSSDPDAKASTMRPQQLENTKTNTKNRKILASTIQNSKNKPHPSPLPGTTPKKRPTAGPRKQPHTKPGARFLRTQQRAPPEPDALSPQPPNRRQPHPPDNRASIQPSPQRAAP